MTDTPKPDREALRRRARAMAVRLGHARPEPEQAPPAPVLPEHLTRHPGALRGMLATGRLDREQENAARAFLADLAAEERLSAPIHHFPEDAA